MLFGDRLAHLGRSRPGKPRRADDGHGDLAPFVVVDSDDDAFARPAARESLLDDGGHDRHAARGDCVVDPPEHGEAAGLQAADVARAERPGEAGAAHVSERHRGARQDDAAVFDGDAGVPDGAAVVHAAAAGFRHSVRGDDLQARGPGGLQKPGACGGPSHEDCVEAPGGPRGRAGEKAPELRGNERCVKGRGLAVKVSGPREVFGTAGPGVDGGQARNGRTELGLKTGDVVGRQACDPMSGPAEGLLGRLGGGEKGVPRDRHEASHARRRTRSSQNQSRFGRDWAASEGGVNRIAAVDERFVRQHRRGMRLAGRVGLPGRAVSEGSEPPGDVKGALAGGGARAARDCAKAGGAVGGVHVGLTHGNRPHA